MYILREAKSLDDYEAFLALKSQKDAVRWSGFESAPDPLRFKQYYIEKVLNNPATHLFFLCDDSEESCPIVGYRQYDQMSDLAIEIRGTTIKKSYQGTDALAALNTLMRKHYKEKGFISFVTWISEKNKASEMNTINEGWTKTDTYEIRHLPLLGGEHKFFKWIKNE